MVNHVMKSLEKKATRADAHEKEDGSMNHPHLGEISHEGEKEAAP